MRHSPISAKRFDDPRRGRRKSSPDNFKDESTADKTVEIGPDMSEEPIKGIDPPQRRKSR